MLIRTLFNGKESLGFQHDRPSLQLSNVSVMHETRLNLLKDSSSVIQAGIKSHLVIDVIAR